MKKFFLLVILLIGAFMLPAAVSASVPPEPTYGTAVVDGYYTEWNLANDFFGNMYRAGDPLKELEARAYVRYDCSAQTVYVLVLTEDTIPAQTTDWEAAAWTKIIGRTGNAYDGNSGNDGNPPDFAWIDAGAYGPGTARGYEASFKLNPGIYNIVVHVEVYDDSKNQTAATVGFPKDGKPLVLDCTHQLTVTKTADTSFTRTYLMTITKAVTPAHYDMFTGDSVSPEYTITATKDQGTDSNWEVSGTITITNPSTIADFDILSVSDEIDPQISADVTCPSLFIPHGSTLECTYHTLLPDGRTRHNVASVVTTSGTFTSPTTDVAFTTPTEVQAPITVTDNSGGSTLTFTEPGTQTYTKTFTCDGNVGNNVNTATVVETGQTASATFHLDCYHLDINKWATTSADRTYEWTISKSADQSSLILQTGQQFLVNYLITVNHPTFTDSNLLVNGEIHVNNRAVIPATITGVSDVVFPEYTGTVTCPVEFPFTLDPAKELVCTYSTSVPDESAGTNTGTATIQNYQYDATGNPTEGGTTDFSNTATFNFNNPTLTEFDECIDVSDTIAGTLGTVCHGIDQLPKTYTYTHWIGPYATSGEYSVDNTASFMTNENFVTGNSLWTTSVSVPLSGCTLTVGYWKTHSAFGPAPYDDGWLMIGLSGANEQFFISGQTYYQVLWTNPGGNAYYILAWQYIPAKLNILNGVGAPSQVNTCITNAETFFNTYTPKTKLSKTLSSQAISCASILANYNLGNLGYPHCTEQAA